jgi:hypothetical protein
LCTGILSSFKSAFGHERVAAHAESDTELLHSVQQQWQIIEADALADDKSRHHYVACSPISSAESLSSLMSEHMDAANYHILVHSVNIDAACYTMQGTLKEVSSISAGGKGVLRFAPHVCLSLSTLIVHVSRSY